MAYAYIPEANRKDKLSKKAEKLRFVGYSLQTKAIDILVDGLETAHVSHTFHAKYLRALLAGVKETRPPKVVL